MKRKRARRRPSASTASAPPPAKALEALERARAPLFAELRQLIKDPDYLRGQPAHVSCCRPLNQMRISPAEAWSIAVALRDRPELRRRLPEIRRRLRKELERLRDTTARQSFDCPLLENGLCLVHHAAKPIGCLAWNPGLPYSDVGWFAFARRDALNDEVYGPAWALRVIPLWLARVLGEPLKIGSKPSPARREGASTKSRGASARGSPPPSRGRAGS